MKKTILIMALVFGFAGLSEINAQQQNQGKNKTQRLEKMQEELSLTDDQVDQMKTLHDQFRTEMQEKRKNETLTREEFQETMEQQREEHQNQIRNILNEEQKGEFDAFTKQGRGPHFKNRHPGNGHKKLSDEQIAELKEKRLEFDNELSDEEKEVIADFRVNREERQSENQADCKKDGTGPRHGQRGFKHDREEMKPMFDIVKNHKESLMAILDEYRPERPEDCPNDYPQRNKRGKAGFGERPGFMAMYFLMMDTESIDMGSVDEQLMNVNIFPNPARNLVSISYELPDDGNVLIELLNKNGNVLELIELSHHDKGLNEVTYDAGNLTPGEMYFVKVSTDQGVHVDKFIKM